jgi:Mrp family chromosome partitioning ATPase
LITEENEMADNAENCTHDCSSCSANCSSREAEKEDFRAHLNPSSSVKKVIGVVSGKGGVGKSLITTMLAVKTRARGFNVGILDADITGPSIPKAFGLTGGVAESPDGLMIPAVTNSGISVMSSNLLLENATDPVIWRGPIIANAVKQFWTDALWENIDFMYVDMPPGTGDVPLTVFQSLPVDGIVIVTSPQELVSMIVTKAVNMAREMNIPIIGLIENMSYFECPDCGARHSVFGPSHIDEIAAETGIPVLAKIPINPETAKAVDMGTVEFTEAPWIEEAVDTITGSKQKETM